MDEKDSGFGSPPKPQTPDPIPRKKSSAGRVETASSRFQTKRHDAASTKVLKTLSSVKLAISLLVVIAVVLIVATVMKSQTQAQRHIYHSWWFISLLGLFSLNLLLCATRRWSFRLRRLGTTVTHAGVLVLVIGAVLGGIWGERGLMQLYIGDSSTTCYVSENEKMVLPFVVHLQDFEVERYREKGVQERLVVQLVDSPASRPASRGIRLFPVKVGETFQVSGTPYSVSILRYEPDFVILGEGVYGSRSASPHNPALEVRVEGGSEESPRWVFAKFPGMFQDTKPNVGLFYQRIESIKAFKSNVRLFDAGKVVASKTIEVNKPLRYKGYNIYQSSYDREREMYSVLEISRDPGIRFVYLGFLIISAGVVFTFYFRPLLLKRRSAKKRIISTG